MLKDIIKNPTLMPKSTKRDSSSVEAWDAYDTPYQDTHFGKYYNRLGNLIEEHPIVSAGIRRS